MGFLTAIQYGILKHCFPEPPRYCSGAAFLGRSKLQVLLGASILERLRGKTVIDFGCGDGVEALEMARLGAKRVVGIDKRQSALDRARAAAAAAGLSGVCTFAAGAGMTADVIISLDAFEHFEDPAGVLNTMYDLLRPGGEVIASFGPTWYHPLGGHLFSVFPWAHLLFSEDALMRWRSDFKSDGAARFSEVEGGLNRMTIVKFVSLAHASRFHLASLETVPIRRLGFAHNRLTREFFTAFVRCRMVKPGAVERTR